MDKNKDKVKLNDELLDQVSGGDSISGMTDNGGTCPSCGYGGPHQCTITYDMVDGKWTYKTVILCGSCGAQIQ
ncbi:MAG: hypothetical protein K6C08_13220 [Oscillospiraceae bacterium]|nr:hypothetical protein [Oscillospiraceae bacterium]